MANHLHRFTIADPSSILRAPDEKTRREQEKQFIRDLKQIAE